MLNRLVSRASVLLDILLVDEVDFYLFFYSLTLQPLQRSRLRHRMFFVFKYYRKVEHAFQRCQGGGSNRSFLLS